MGSGPGSNGAARSAQVGSPRRRSHCPYAAAGAGGSFELKKVATCSDEAVDIGLCYGWISGQRKALDELSYLQKYVPRRPRSRWSQVNVRKVEELMAAGRMRPSGLAEVEAPKADGRWDAAYTSQKEAGVPPNLAAALAANPQSASAFESLGKADRYGVILDIVTARNPPNRAAHVRKAIAALESGRG